MLFQVAGGFYFDKTPTVLLAALHDVSLNDYALMLKGTLKDRRDFAVCD